MEINPDMMETNRARLSGVLLSDPEFSHRTYGESFYETKIGITRSSGYVDEIRMQISERLVHGLDIGKGTKAEVRGQVRTYNEDAGGRNRLNVIVFVREIDILPQDEEPEYINDIFFSGYICKRPVKRTSPLGREICDVMLAVHRMYNKSDYIPCIAWGRNASYVATLGVGEELVINGRIQSREYKKKDASGNPVTNTAYEVSIVKIEG